MYCIGIDFYHSVFHFHSQRDYHIFFVYFYYIILHSLLQKMNVEKHSEQHKTQSVFFFFVGNKSVCFSSDLT